MPSIYRGADKSLSRPGGGKQVNVYVRIASVSFGALPCMEKEIDDSSCLDVVEIARDPDMFPSLFPSWSVKIEAKNSIDFSTCSYRHANIWS